jgi:hypothetical protein
MEEAFAAVNYTDTKLHDRIKNEADKKFGAKTSYVKNLWIHREYKKRGGKSSYKGKKPSSKKIQKQINASQNTSPVIEVDINSLL